MEKSYKLLIVEDEPDLCEILQFNLESEGYTVDIANSAEEALTKNLAQYDLLLLDVMMGQMSGFKLAQLLKSKPETKHIPIIFLTARVTENDVLTGFNTGADDYILKPFSIKVVAARIKAVLSRTRSGNAQSNELVRFETMEIDLNAKQVSIAGKSIELTKTEFELLALFVQNPTKVFSRESILTQVWTEDVYVTDRTVDVHITRLRKKIEPYGKNIVTRSGYGYCFL
ncbi:winged helix-turn-helix domain-containing protein [Paludibacter jiangxiensis]|uniref:Phosphate regulon transcriptional regulatory protein PhoB n=1 Tax=Paludibacter jiangxiensis TaxID=681398 RepID=A0A161LIW2_9BACT|nr:response regulator transcription factor [Paludibacter jiangxiensis]GAT62436.1 DNA-binding response regulator, OmpR family [Paludibacter jiangxiensis]